MGCNNDFRCDDFVNREASQLARMLDHGRGEEVANALQRDAYEMSPRDFKNLVHRTAEMDQKGRGDDIFFDRRDGGVHIVSRDGRNFRPCDVYEDRVVPRQIIVERPVIVEQPPVMRPYPDRVPPYYEPHRNTTVEGGVIGGAVGAGLGAIIDRRNPGRGAAIGGISGIIGGVLGGSLDRR